MIFLSGIPRSGSTLLAALLSQRPDTYVSATSGLCDIMGATVTTWEQHPGSKASGDGDGIRLLKAVADAHYADRNEPIIVDKGRGWPAPQIIQTMKKVQGEVKIIATVRPVAECLASFVKLVKPENVKDFCKNSELANHLFNSYHALKAGYEAHPECFLFVEYDDLVSNPQNQADRIANFIGCDKFVHTFEDIEPVKENDSVWGVKNLHKVRKKIHKRKFSRKNILGDKLWTFYKGGEFWNDKPEPEKKIDVLDLQYKALMQGEYEKAKEMCYKLLKERPDCNRVAFNAGWFKLSEGKVLEGYRLLDRGRNETVWGDPDIGSKTPIWRGQKGVTVLLRLERGLGDQIHQVRYAKDLKKRGCTTIVSCSPELADIARHADGVDVVVQHEAALGTLHDFWLPAMSTPMALEYKQKDIRGGAYVERPPVDVVPGRIGLRWQGNPLYEHATKRLFPPELLFDAVKGRDCISLQKGDGEDRRPSWVRGVSLDTWTDTAKAIASCELVISSCTAIAHLAGAMGVKTWNIIPLVPYYLWTYPGDKTPYYNSMILFRQTDINNWEEPFKKIKRRLGSKKELKKSDKEKK